MTRPSPQTDRLRRIVQVLAADPRHPLNLAQIARQLGVSKATCLPMVAAMTSSGWLVRHPTHKTYRLGPALIEIGRAAGQASAAEDVVDRLTDLASWTGRTCLLWEHSGDDLVLGEIVGPDGAVATWAGLRPGHRIRPIAPLGACLVAWDEHAEQHWLDGIAADDLPAARRRCRAGLAAVRRWGYAVELQNRPQHEVFKLVERLKLDATGELDELVRSVADQLARQLVASDYLVDELDPRGRYEPVSINAPVFDRYRAVEMIVCLVDVPPGTSGADVAAMGRAVRNCAAEMTRAHGGVLPAGWGDDRVAAPVVRGA